MGFRSGSWPLWPSPGKWPREVASCHCLSHPPASSAGWWRQDQHGRTQEQCGLRPPSRGQAQAGSAGYSVDTEGRLVFQASSVTLSLSKSVWAAECTSLHSELASPHKGGSCPPVAPSMKKSHCPQQGRPAGGARSTAHRRAQQKGPHSGLSARISRRSRLNVPRYFMSRAAAGPWRDECPLLSTELFYLHFLNSLSR